MISEFQQKEAVVDYGLRRMERKIEIIERKSDVSDRDKIEVGKTLEFIKAVKELKGAYKKTLDAGLGKLPPQDLELESAILGAIILESKSVGVKKILEYLMPPHFYLDVNRKIYETVLNLHQSNVPADLRMIISELKHRGLLDVCGGPSYVMHLTTLVSSSSAIEYRCRYLIELSIKRELILMAGQLLHDSYSDGTDCFELIAGVKDKLSEIERINVRK